MIDIATLPEEPGCYLFRDADGTIIYIGKAKNIRRRVASYFHRRASDPKTRHMIDLIASTDFIVTDSEVEALILENTLVKKNQPKYNINLKDSKNYAYIHITDDEFPRIGIARRASGNGKFYGPFVSAKERDYILAVVKKTFQLRSCRRLPRRACLRYHIGSCSAPCIGNIGSAQYAERIYRAESVLRGHVDELLESMRDEMEEKSSRQEYEQAMELRDQIRALEHLSERQHVKRQKSYDEDIINYLFHEGRVYLMLFNVHRGTLSDKQEYVFDEQEDVIEEFIVQYYSENEPPSELVLPEELDGALIEFLSAIKGKKVRVSVPKRGAKRKLLDLVEKNIQIAFFGDRLKLEALQKAIGLPEPPSVIECFDISHHSGSAMVGSMVQFRSGRPDKQHYRRFKIRTVDQIDDYAAIAEVVRRRYSRLIREDGVLPDLIIIDGGKGQLSATTTVLDRFKLKIPVISIAKREEEIYVPGLNYPLPLSKNQRASLFIQEIRDEAHRFALSYSRLLRKKELVS